MEQRRQHIQRTTVYWSAIIGEAEIAVHSFRTITSPGVDGAAEHILRMTSNVAPHGGEAIRAIGHCHTTWRELRDPQRGGHPILSPMVDDVAEIGLIAIRAQRKPRPWPAALPIQRVDYPGNKRVFGRAVGDGMVRVHRMNLVSRLDKPAAERFRLLLAARILRSNPGRMHDLVQDLVAKAPH